MESKEKPKKKYDSTAYLEIGIDFNSMEINPSYFEQMMDRWLEEIEPFLKRDKLSISDCFWKAFDWKPFDEDEDRQVMNIDEINDEWLPTKNQLIGDGNKAFKKAIGENDN